MFDDFGSSSFDSFGSSSFDDFSSSSFDSFDSMGGFSHDDGLCGMGSFSEEYSLGMAGIEPYATMYGCNTGLSDIGLNCGLNGMSRTGSLFDDSIGGTSSTDSLFDSHSVGGSSSFMSSDDWDDDDQYSSIEFSNGSCGPIYREVDTEDMAWTVVGLGLVFTLLGMLTVIFQ